MVALDLVDSKGEAHRALAQRGIYANGRQLEAAERSLRIDQALYGRYFLLRKGKREYGVIAVAR
jgi:tyrosyl-tRNA synthetase